MPLDVCVAQSQGMIGYMLQISLQNALKEAKIMKSAVTILTQTLVHKDDPQFNNPSKPIGPFYTAMEASNCVKKKDGPLLMTVEGDIVELFPHHSQ